MSFGEIAGFLRIGFLVFLPGMVLIGGGWLMDVISGRLPTAKPLNHRILGYSAEDVGAEWREIEAVDPGLSKERTFLELDLAFPFFYGGAFAVSLLALWAGSGRGFNPIWCVIPVVLAMVADWTENSVLLQILGHLSPPKTMVQVASWATQLKLIGCGICSFMILVLAVLGRPVR